MASPPLEYNVLNSVEFALYNKILGLMNIATSNWKLTKIVTDLETLFTGNTW